MTTWNDVFEAAPTDEDYGYTIDNFFRELKTAISERMVIEHIWKVGATDGKHSPGKCSVFYYGTTVEIDALTGMSEGAIAFDATLGTIKVYTSSVWTILPFNWDAMWGAGDPVHNHLSNAEGGVITLTSLKFLATPINLINWTAATDWTDVDISASTGTDIAKAALLAVQLDFQPRPSGADNAMTGFFRVNGSSEIAILPRIRTGGRYSAGQYSVPGKNAGTIITNVDTSQIFETKLQQDEGASIDIVYKVDLIGYYI